MPSLATFERINEQSECERTRRVFSDHGIACSSNQLRGKRQLEGPFSLKLSRRGMPKASAQ